ncbi:MAG: tRNA epoxyqueuosine(34) reductase QueG [Phycisphaerales bacterium]|nr:tRNA epoxyqueuosine(34) reductase QueG [Phycisphaerales bacterium]
MSPAEKTRRLKELLSAAGFCRCGVAVAGPIGRVPYLERWLSSGRAGTMAYLHGHRAFRTDPAKLLDGGRSVVVAAMNYRQREPATPDDGRPRGRVAMYAWGDDYHDVMRRRLDSVVDRFRAEVDETFEARCCVDTAPLLERELAAMAGVGWIGKNTMVLHQDVGSYFFLGEIVTTLELAPDEPVADHCGRCTRCLDACPTGAFPAAYEMDASKCISYLTIEHRGEIAGTFHRAMGDWVFGCDVCQEVCPFNRDTPYTTEFGVGPPGPRPALADIVAWDEDAYRATLKGSATRRAKLPMWKRNAGIAVKNHAAENTGDR